MQPGACTIGQDAVLGGAEIVGEDDLHVGAMTGGRSKGAPEAKLGLAAVVQGCSDAVTLRVKDISDWWAASRESPRPRPTVAWVLPRQPGHRDAERCNGRRPMTILGPTASDSCPWLHMANSPLTGRAGCAVAGNRGQRDSHRSC